MNLQSEASAKRDADIRRLREDGLTDAEIAARLGISAGTVENRRRALGIGRLSTKRPPVRLTDAQRAEAGPAIRRACSVALSLTHRAIRKSVGDDELVSHAALVLVESFGYFDPARGNLPQYLLSRAVNAMLDRARTSGYRGYFRSGDGPTLVQLCGRDRKEREKIEPADPSPPPGAALESRDFPPYLRVRFSESEWRVLVALTESGDYREAARRAGVSVARVGHVVSEGRRRFGTTCAVGRRVGGAE